MGEVTDSDLHVAELVEAAFALIEQATPHRKRGPRGDE